MREGGTKGSPVDTTRVTTTSTNRWRVEDLTALGAVNLDGIGAHVVLQSDWQDRLTGALHEWAGSKVFGGVLVVHSVKTVSGSAKECVRDYAMSWRYVSATRIHLHDVSCVYQTVESTSGLCQVTVVGIVWAYSVENQIKAVGKVGDTGAEAVEVKAVLNVGALDFTKHFVTLETTKPAS